MTKLSALVASFLIDEGDLAEEILVHAHAKDTDEVPAFRHASNSYFIILRMKDLFNDPGSGMIKPVKEY